MVAVGVPCTYLLRLIMIGKVEELTVNCYSLCNIFLKEYCFNISVTNTMCNWCLY